MSTTPNQINRRQLLAETTHHPNTLELANLTYIDSDKSTESDDQHVARNRRSFLGATAGAVAALTLGIGAMTEPAEAACSGTLVCHRQGNAEVTLCVSSEGRVAHRTHHERDTPGRCL